MEQVTEEGMRVFNDREEARKAKGPDETVIALGKYPSGTFGLSALRGTTMTIYALVKKQPRKPPL